MLELVLGLGAAALTGGALFAGWSARKRRSAWGAAMSGAAAALGGRVSAGGAGDAPELRAEIEERTLTLRLAAVLGARDRRGATAALRLPDGLTPVRLYLGWGVDAAPSGLDHLPSIEQPDSAGLEGRFTVRAEDAALAARFVRAARLDLLDVMRELDTGDGVEVVVRGGYLDLGVRALACSAPLIERMARAARGLAGHLEAAAAGPTALPPPALAPARRECALCADLERAKERWVGCARCGAAYHADCFVRAGACVIQGCDERRADPLPSAEASSPP
jgi:hypothetical protein